MTINYTVNARISTAQFLDILDRSTLAQRRPIDDLECIEGMLQNGNLLATAWDGDKLVGIARSVTDFHFACYLSDLAVDQAYQRMGVGSALIATTLNELGPHCKIRLLSAPAAVDYYPKIGFVQNANCWELSHGAWRNH